MWTPGRIQFVEKAIDTYCRPFRVQLEDGTVAYVKHPSAGKVGPWVLGCDLIGTRAAEFLQLGVAAHAVRALTPDDLLAFDTPPSAVPCFFSQHVPGVEWSGAASTLTSLENPQDLAGLVVLDTWTYNCDRRFGNKRNLGNVYLARGTRKKLSHRVIALDQGACFSCSDPIPTVPYPSSHVKTPKIYGLFEEFEPYVLRDAVVPFLDVLRTFTPQHAVQFTAGVPNAWQISGPAVKNLQQLLVQRARFLASHLEGILEDQCRWQGKLI